MFESDLTTCRFGNRTAPSCAHPWSWQRYAVHRATSGAKYTRPIREWKIRDGFAGPASAAPEEHWARPPRTVSGLRLETSLVLCEQQNSPAPAVAACPVSRNCIYFIDGSFSVAPECDLLSVRRPAWIQRIDWRIGKLQPLATVDPAAPKTSHGIGNVGDPFSIFRESSGFC